MAHPGAPVFGTVLPKADGTISVADAVGSATPTYTRATTAMVFDGWADKWVKTHLTGASSALATNRNAARFHGARTHHNFTKAFSSWTVFGAASFASGTGVLSGLTGTADGTHSQLTSANDVQVFDLGVGGRKFAGFITVQGVGVDVGKDITLLMRVDGSGTLLDSMVVRLTSDARTYGLVGGVSGAGLHGIRLQVTGVASNTAAAVTLSNGAIYEVTHCISATSSAAWAVPVINRTANSKPVWFPYVSPLETNSFWRTPGRYIDTSDSNIVTAPATAGIYGRVIDYDDDVAPLHPVRLVDNTVSTFDVYPLAQRNKADYAVGDRVVPDGLRPFNNGAGGSAYIQTSVYLECTATGTTHASTTLNTNTGLATATAWTLGTTTFTDGTVTWRIQGRYTRHGVIGYVAEEQRQNQANANGDDFNTGWTKGGGIASADITAAIGFSGLSNNRRLRDNSAVNNENVYEPTAATESSGDTFTGSAFIRKYELGSEHFPGVGVFHVSANTGHFATINPETGASGATSTYNAGTTYVEDWGDWWRLISVFTLGTNSIIRLYVGAAFAQTLNGAFDVAAQNAGTTFSFAQLEEAAYASTPIVNAGSQVTRNGDSLSWPTASTGYDNTIGFMQAIVHRYGNHANASTSGVVVGFDAASTPLHIQQAAGTSRMRGYDSTNLPVTATAGVTGLPSAGQHRARRTALHWSLNDADAAGAQLRLRLSGDAHAAATNTSFDGTGFTGTALTLGAYTTPSQAMHGGVSSFLIWNDDMTANVASTLESDVAFNTAPTYTATITGTATTGVDEDDITANDKTVIITLGGGAEWWSGALFTNVVADILAGLTGSASWNSAIAGASVVRTSPSVATITLDSFGSYDISSTDTITVVVPAVATTAFQAINGDTTFAITHVAAGSITLGGTSITGTPHSESVFVSPGLLTLTIDLTGTGFTFKAAGTGPIGSSADSALLVNGGVNSAQSETFGFNAVVRDVMDNTALVRNSSTLATITFPAAPTFDITAEETVGVIIPNDVFVEGPGAQVVTTDAFRIMADGVPEAVTSEGCTGMMVSVGCMMIR